MSKEISEIIGADRTGLRVYRALRSLFCRDCGDPIAKGALFTRWPLSTDGLRILPRCRKCVPLDLPEDGARPPSELMGALLSTDDDGAPADISRQKKIEEEINKRLSPALERTRRLRPR